jgi:DNA-binding response OmpR family regulator
VFTREQILNYLWGESDVSSPSSVTVFIRKIREKLETDPAAPRYLLTVWRVGYKFCAENEEGQMGFTTLYND